MWFFVSFKDRIEMIERWGGVKWTDQMKMMEGNFVPNPDGFFGYVSFVCFSLRLLSKII